MALAAWVVVTGLAATAWVITGSARMMTGVLLAFLLSTNVVSKMLGLGLGASILIEVTVIPLVFLPTCMFVLGRYNWWRPRWPDRILPGRADRTEASPAPFLVPIRLVVADPAAPVAACAGR